MSMASILKTESRWSLLIWLACLALVVLLGSCSSPSQKPTHAPISTCQGIDWYEIGRRDGATGASINLLDDYKKQCRKDKNHPDDELYINGRNAGLVGYCTPLMGLETARFARTYGGVCPSHLEKPFLRGFQAGQKIRTLESENAGIDRQIAALSRAAATVDGGVNSTAADDVTGPISGGANVAGPAPATRHPASAESAEPAHAKVSALHKRHAANESAITALEQSALEAERAGD